MNKYAALYNGNGAELEAKTLYDAKKLAIQHFKVPKSKEGLLTVILIEKDGQTAPIDTSSL